MLFSRRTKSILGLVLATSFILIGASVSALTLDCPTGEKNKSSSSSGDGDIPDLDTDCGGVPSTLKRYLLDAGYSEDAAAGIMGNIYGESNFSPKRIQGKKQLVGDDFVAYSGGKRSSQLVNSKGNNLGFGLAQWTTSGRLKKLQAYANSIGKPVASVEAQAQFIVKEMSSSYSKYCSPEKLNAMTMEEATWTVEKRYEIPQSTFCVGDDCCSKEDVEAGKCTGKKTNEVKPPYDVHKLESNAANHQLAYSSYIHRLNGAKASKALDVSSCQGSSGSGGSSGGGSSGGDPVSVVNPSEVTPTTTTTGAAGKSSAKGLISQYDSDIRYTVWRRDKSTIGASGCSLVAVVNAATGIGKSVSANTLASWTKSNFSNASWDNLFKMVKHVGLSASSYLWTSKSTSESKKIEAIRSALASGGAIIASGDRSGTSYSCDEASNRDNGSCVFTPGGHFVAIVGITSDNKLVIGNPARASNKTWIFPASNALKYSNKAIMVK
ncbi:C39 family peptidase [Candidatus Saccharibacteria bacterium]|nr:C39 family peptidase [Candidatus Saccharibacteria bacterium]